MIKGKKGGFLLWIILIVLILLIGCVAGYVYYYWDELKPNRGGDDNGVVVPRTVMANPAANKTDAEAEVQFNEDYVRFLLYSLGANELHTVPLGNENPLLEIKVGEDVYNAEIVDGRVDVGSGEIEGEDVRIVTSAKEGVKMIRDRSYVYTSFKEGGSSIELVAGEAELFAKGYKKIYDRVSGK